MLNNPRIEDVKFTPNKEYIILPDYRNDVIYAQKDNDIYKFISTDGGIKVPHGIYFIDDELFVVANRNNRQQPNGFISIFRLPTIVPEQKEYEIITLVKSNEMMASGVVSYLGSDSLYIILVVCNNNQVSKYTFYKKYSRFEIQRNIDFK